ncbi:MAG: hypothetical protein GY810_15540, partial [Aureispira sp.]|nr:hypothetical protein [Aureispira sp.]
MNESDIAVAKNDIEHIRDTLHDIKTLAIDTKKQATKTNGRVNLLEVNKKERERLRIPYRINSLEKWKYGIMTVCMIVLLGGYRVITWSFDGMVRESLSAYTEDYNKKIDAK